MKIIILGSGTSHGIPVLGCGCPVCTSKDRRDKRTRASVYIEGRNGEAALIDAGPEFRLQALGAGIRSLDALFLTHSHADHIHGLDDLRPLCHDTPIPVYGNETTISDMKKRFSYIWAETQRGGGKPRLTPLVARGPVTLGGLCFTPIPVKHGILDILGWEVEESAENGNSFLYLTDTSAIPEETRRKLREKPLSGRRVIVIDGLRTRPHETHFSFEAALDNALSLVPDRANKYHNTSRVYLTHICHNHSHKEIEEFCQHYKESRGLGKIGIHPARDGLTLTL